MLESITQCNKPVVELLIGRQQREPGKEIVLGEGMYLLDLEIVLLAGCKQIDGHDFLIGEFWF